MSTYEIYPVQLKAASSFTGVCTVLEPEERYDTHYARNLLVYPERTALGRTNGNLICTLRYERHANEKNVILVFLEKNCVDDKKFDDIKNILEDLQIKE